MGGKPRNNRIVVGDLTFDRRQLCGKSAAYWEQVAKKSLIERLVRAAFQCDERTIHGSLTARRLIELASTEDPDLYVEVLQDRSRCIEGFEAIMTDLLGPQ